MIGERTHHQVEVIYGDTHIKMGDAPDTYKLTCTKDAGWQLWNDKTLLAGEHHPVRLTIVLFGIVLCGEVPRHFT